MEDIWLDLASAPLRRRLEEAGWTPSEPASYCERCGLSVGAYGADETGCAECRTKRFPWKRLVRLGAYDEPLARMVQEVKFTRWRRLGRDLGRVLGQQVAAALAREAGAPAVGGLPPLIVPVPMSLTRRLLRGIDHSLALARGVADATGGEVWRALSRRHGPSQTSVNRSDRASNVTGSMRMRRWGGRLPDLDDRVVLVVDDVVTTGATMRCACRALADGVGAFQKPLIWAAVVARTEVEAGAGVARPDRDMEI